MPPPALVFHDILGTIQEWMSKERTCWRNMQIEVTTNPSAEMIDKLGCRSWSVWEKEPSTFPWNYDEKETCLVLDGKVTVTPNGGEPVTFGKGDLVVFPQGMSCTWNVQETVRKHYKFGN